jgi:type VI protein secretion system component VasF
MLKEWCQRRQQRQAKHEAARQRLHEEYLQRLESSDPDGLEASHDYGDNDLTPWRTEASMGLVFAGFVVLMVLVVALVALFAAIKSLTG